MLREIYDQPQALKRTLDLYLGAKALKPEIAAALAHWPNPTGEILIAASGSSRNSGLYGEILLEDLCGLAVDVEYASEYSCRGGPASIDARHPSVLVLSQSGETSDTLAALGEARRQGHNTMAITNAAQSTMATQADVTLLLAAGQERAIPATKSFTCQLAALYVLALYEGARRHRMDAVTIAARIDELFSLPHELWSQLDAWRGQIEALAARYSTAATVLFLGRGIHYAIAREGAHKLKEASYVYAEGFPAGELKHRPNALVSDLMPLVVLATVDSALQASVLRYEKTLELLADLRAQSARVIALATEDDTRVPALVNDCIFIPQASEYLLPILEVVPLQLFAYFMAIEHGVDVDRPRNLSKSVVEK